MPPLPPETDLNHDDVVGQRLVEVLQSDRIVESGLETVYTFFRLESDAVFAMPFEDAGVFFAEEPRPDCFPAVYAEIVPVL